MCKNGVFAERGFKDSVWSQPMVLCCLLEDRLPEHKVSLFPYFFNEWSFFFIQEKCNSIGLWLEFEVLCECFVWWSEKEVILACWLISDFMLILVLVVSCGWKLKNPILACGFRHWVYFDVKFLFLGCHVLPFVLIDLFTPLLYFDLLHLRLVVRSSIIYPLLDPTCGIM